MMNREAWQAISGRALSFVLMVLASWYFWGILGWLIVIYNYPLEDVLPRYAG